VPFISFVTLAESHFGAHHARWGSAPLQKLEVRLATAEIVWPGPSLVESYVKLRHDCAAIGHGLSHKDHEPDRWIAATALWLRVPLVRPAGGLYDALSGQRQHPTPVGSVAPVAWTPLA
jgi:predicted nucleic acid-binding protein